MSVRLDHGKDELEDIHEINVTPFIDVILVLLIIFMIAAPLATVDVNVNLPGLTADPQKRPDKPIFLTIKADHSLALGDNPVARDALTSALNAETNGDKNQNIFLRADKTLPYGDFAEVINLLRRAGYLRVALVGLEADKKPVSMALTIPSERTQKFLRWGVCFAVVLLVHAVAVANCWSRAILLTSLRGPEVVKLDIAARRSAGDGSTRSSTRPQSLIEQEVKPQQEPEQKEAEVALPKEVQQPNRRRRSRRPHHRRSRRRRRRPRFRRSRAQVANDREHTPQPIQALSHTGAYAPS